MLKRSFHSRLQRFFSYVFILSKILGSIKFELSPKFCEPLKPDPSVNANPTRKAWSDLQLCLKIRFKVTGMLLFRLTRFSIYTRITSIQSVNVSLKKHKILLKPISTTMSCKIKVKIHSTTV